MNQPQPIPQPSTWRRTALNWAPPALAATVVVVLILTAGDAAGRLAYIKVLAWPLVVAVALWSLRTPIASKIASLARLEGFGGVADFGTGDVFRPAANDALAQATEKGPSPEEGSTSTGTEDPGDEAAKWAIEQRHREGIERLIKTSVLWGYAAASQNEDVPELVITWTDDGRPEIAGAWTGDGIPIAAGREANRLIQRLTPSERAQMMDFVLRIASQSRRRH